MFCSFVATVSRIFGHVHIWLSRWMWLSCGMLGILGLNVQWEGSLHVRLPLPLTPTASWGVPKPLWVWMVSYKDSQNSPKAVILTVMVYYKERVQIKMSSKEKMPGTESSSVPSAGFFHPLSIESGLVILLVLMCNNTECCQPEGSPRLQHSEFLLGLHDWLITDVFDLRLQMDWNCVT